MSKKKDMIKVASVSDRLYDYMALHKCKQVDILDKVRPIAEREGVKFNSSSLSQYVKGIVEPGPDKIKVMAEGMGVSEDWLQGYIKKEGTYVSPRLRTDDGAYTVPDMDILFPDTDIDALIEHSVSQQTQRISELYAKLLLEQMRSQQTNETEVSAPIDALLERLSGQPADSYTYKGTPIPEAELTVLKAALTIITR